MSEDGRFLFLTAKYRTRPIVVSEAIDAFWHQHIQHAAEEAEAPAAQGKFWEMHDYLYEHQSHLDDAALLRYATEIGLDMERFTHDLKEHKFAARVKEDFQSGIRSGVNGTPTFFINGLRHDGAWDLETLNSAVLAAAD